MKVREYCAGDIDTIVKLFHDTIHTVSIADYTPAQCNAWSPKAADLVAWNTKLSEQYALVAEADNRIVGFGSADNTGYFDLLYTHKDYQRRGVATLVADDIEHYVLSQGIKAITTNASITARPFFAQRGYRLLAAQTVMCRGQAFVNFKMQKRIKS